MDLISRPNNKQQREAEFKKEFSINLLTKTAITDVTRALEYFLQGDSEIVPKKILEALFLGDEGALALLSLRTVLTSLILTEDNRVLLSTISKSLNKSIIFSKSLKQLEEQHASLNAYIDLRYKRDESRKLRAKLKSHTKLFGETQEKMLLEQPSSADGVGSLLITTIANVTDMIQVVKLDSRCMNNGIRYNGFKPFSYVVEFTEEMKYQLINLDFVAGDLLKPNVLPLTKKPQNVIYWYNKDNRLVEDGRPINIVKLPKRKQDLKEFKYILDNNLNFREFQDIFNDIEDTAWAINTDVLDVMQYIFNNNIEDKKLQHYKNKPYAYSPYLIGKLPRRYGLEPDTFLSKSYFGETYFTEKGRELFKADEKEAISQYNLIKNDILAYNEKNLSKALALISMMKVAEDYRNKTFWFTYQYDTRYRIYPVQQALNPQSNTFGKALLKFAENLEPLTQDGHFWAKVHGANVYGFDKTKLEEREAFIDKMIADKTLQQIADFPLESINLWAEADSPFEFLAFCIEYNKVLKDSNHLYSLPCQLDATCSGIQIYSGLLRDRKGAMAVNVIGDTRNDIYQQVADEVNRMLRDGEYKRYTKFTNKNGEEKEIDNMPLARSLVGKINRNITKRNTMTQPYSVTLRGMQDQLLETFKELEDLGEKFWQGEAWEVARFLADVNQRAIDNIVIGAKQGKDFIRKITSIVAQKNQGLLYKNPFGGVVYQKNLQQKAKQIWTHIFTPNKGLEKVRLTIQDKAKKVDSLMQQSASAPNLIHTLDTTLLHFTVRKGTNQGIKNWSLIHDSYGTHPNQIPTLNRVIREEFVNIFKEDVLYDWAIQVLTNAGYTYNQIASIFSELDDAMVNTLDLEEVKKATYIFS